MTEEQSPQENKQGKITLIAILVVSILPIAAAYFVFFTGIGVPGNTVNAGKLLPKALPLKEIVNKEFSNYLDQQKKWRLLLPVSSQCGESCEKNFYTTRQVHIRLGEKGLRVERIAVNIASNEGVAYLESIAEAHPKLKRVDVNASTWKNWLENSGAGLNMEKEHFYFLVDQQGYAMMVYNNAQHGNELLKDIKRALKHSIDYQ